MNDKALILGLLFFAHSFFPEHSSTVFAMAGAFFVNPPGKNYDAWICDLQDRYEPSFRATLVVTQKPVKSVMATVYWPKEGELRDGPYSVQENTYGFVILDITEKEAYELSTDLLTWIHSVMRFGGKLIITDEHKVFAVMEKD